MSSTSIACDLRSAKLFFVLSLDAFVIAGPVLPGTVQMQWPWELTVCGFAACLTAACAPESKVSTDTEMWIYELTFILLSPAV